MSKQRRISLFISGIGAAGAGVIAATVFAGPDNIKFPEGFEKGVLYATVDRYDIKQHRELYATPEAVKAVREGKPIPSGTVLTIVQHAAKTDEKGVPLRGPDGRFVKGDVVGYGVMEKRTGWGSAYPAEWRNGEWEYAAFTKDRKPNEKLNANFKACFDCHKPHENQDFVMSLARLSGTAPGAAVKPSGPGTVAIAEFLFGPEKAVVKAGQTLAWTNVDESPHQVTVLGQTTLRTPVLLKGQSTVLTFNDVGMYDYICGLHPNMKGTIEVTK
ncbi:MAG TPA: cytochrome P460 family protein [Burkholderiales bacterium]|nr:cytochrome P460 family protein [Burkholderiales bacterium]